MSKIAEEKGKKRKGATEPAVSAKKVKTTVARTEQPKVKSALKKALADNKAEDAASSVAPSKSSKPTRKRAEDFLEPAVDTPIIETVTEVVPGNAKQTTKAHSVLTKPEESASATASKAKGKGKAKAEKAGKQSAVEKEPTVVVAAAEEKDDEDEEDVDDQTAALLAGFESSEDENDPEDDEATLDKVPAIPNEKSIRKQLKAAEDDEENTPGVVYVGRIPHGFYEHQMKAYFAQFGEITHLRLSRNKVTGRSKHYSFIEFESAAVADIVAKTMDKYLLFGHILQVRRIPAEQVHEKLWKGEGRRFKVMPRNKIEGSQLKKGKSRENWEKNVQRETRSRSKKAEKMKAMGYEFEMPSLRTVTDVPVKEALEGEGEGAGLLDGADVHSILDSQAEEPKAEVVSQVVEEPSKVTVTEKASVKRTKSKGDGKKAKKAKVAA